jgi:hypothetical protein
MKADWGSETSMVVLRLKGLGSFTSLQTHLGSLLDEQSQFERMIHQNG